MKRNKPYMFASGIVSTNNVSDTADVTEQKLASLIILSREVKCVIKGFAINWRLSVNMK